MITALLPNVTTHASHRRDRSTKGYRLNKQWPNASRPASIPNTQRRARFLSNEIPVSPWKAQFKKSWRWDRQDTRPEIRKSTPPQPHHARSLSSLTRWIRYRENILWANSWLRFQLLCSMKRIELATLTDYFLVHFCVSGRKCVFVIHAHGKLEGDWGPVSSELKSIIASFSCYSSYRNVGLVSCYADTPATHNEICDTSYLERRGERRSRTP